MKKSIETAWAKATAHARQCYPQESVGLVVVVKGRAKYLPFTNIHPSPTAFFALSPDDYLAAEEQGEVIALVHSHPDFSAQPSSEDLSVHGVSGLEWWIIGLPSGPVAEVETAVVPRCEKPALYGRRFVTGATDCYALLRDWYQEARGIALPDFARMHDWWSRGENLFSQFEKAGFVELPIDADWQEGDVLLMLLSRNPGNVADHCAVWLAGDRIAHHPIDRLSGIENYSRFYRDRTTLRLRYKG